MDTTVHRFPVRNICPECNESFTLKATLKAHIASKHISSRKQTHDSNLKSDISDLSTFSGHFNGVHSAKFLTSKDRLTSTSTSSNSTITNDQWRYNGGDSYSDTRNSLDQQVAKNHGESSTNDTSGYDTDLTIIQEDVPLFRCNICVKSFNAEWKLTQHLNSSGHQQRLIEMKPGAELASENDEMRFTEDDTSGYETDKHGATKMFHCVPCSKSFDVESRFIQHTSSDGHRRKVKQLKEGEVIEKPTEMFPCNLEECGRKFDNEAKLLQHQQMKHGVKVGVIEVEGSDLESSDFRCTENDCDKVFPTKARLLQHMKDKHAPDKSETPAVRQLCQFCDEFNETAGSKPFIFLTFIAKHILTAHERPGYIKGACPICHMRVEKPKNLLTHISRTHIFHRFKDEACFICLRLCKDKDDLLQHSTSVHRFKCTIDACHSMFPSKTQRDKHMLDKHSVYGCGVDNCQRIFRTLEEKIEHMKLPHQTDGSVPVITCIRGLANVHDRGVMSEPSAFRPIREQSLAHHERNSADESYMRPTEEDVSECLPMIHRNMQEKMEDLTAFINQFSSQLSEATNEKRSLMTFNKCEDLKRALEGVQRRLTPRVD